MDNYPDDIDFNNESSNSPFTVRRCDECNIITNELTYFDGTDQNLCPNCIECNAELLVKDNGK